MKRRNCMGPDGAWLIAAERNEQKKKYDAAHDDQHIAGDLAVAAAVLAAWDTDATVDADDYSCDGEGSWWASELADKAKGRVHRLVMAGALIAAEIDRLRRGGAQ